MPRTPTPTSTPTTTCLPALLRQVSSIAQDYAFLLAIFIRIFFLVYGEWQDQHFQVKYTDVDYKVYTDAADRVYHGESPFRYVVSFFFSSFSSSSSSLL